MNIEYLKLFSKDLSKIKNEQLKQNLFELILELKRIEKFNEIPNLKKLTGHPEAYRIRMGNYRLGLFYDGNTIQLARFVKREDIYKLFP